MPVKTKIWQQLETQCVTTDTKSAVARNYLFCRVCSYNIETIMTTTINVCMDINCCDVMNNVAIYGNLNMHVYELDHEKKLIQLIK